MPIPLARPGATHRFVSQDEKFSFTTTLRVETRLFAEKKNETLPVPSCIRVTTMEYAILDIIGQIEIDETILDWIDGTLKLNGYTLKKTRRKGTLYIKKVESHIPLDPAVTGEPPHYVTHLKAYIISHSPISLPLPPGHIRTLMRGLLETFGPILFRNVVPDLAVPLLSPLPSWNMAAVEQFVLKELALGVEGLGARDPISDPLEAIEKLLKLSLDPKKGEEEWNRCLNALEEELIKKMADKRASNASKLARRPSESEQWIVPWALPEEDDEENETVTKDQLGQDQWQRIADAIIKEEKIREASRSIHQESMKTFEISQKTKDAAAIFRRIAAANEEKEEALKSVTRKEKAVPILLAFMEYCKSLVSAGPAVSKGKMTLADDLVKKCEKMISETGDLKLVSTVRPFYVMTGILLQHLRFYTPQTLHIGDVYDEDHDLFQDIIHMRTLLDSMSAALDLPLNSIVTI